MNSIVTSHKITPMRTLVEMFMFQLEHRQNGPAAGRHWQLAAQVASVMKVTFNNDEPFNFFSVSLQSMMVDGSLRTGDIQHPVDILTSIDE